MLQRIQYALLLFIPSPLGRPIKRLTFKQYRQVNSLPLVNEPYERGCQGKILPLTLGGDEVVACIQPNLSSGEAVGSPRIPGAPGSWRLVLAGALCGDEKSSADKVMR